jgi:hypothetical protein
MHYCHDGAQWKGPQIGTILFFQSFAWGIMIEDGVQELWRRVTTTKEKGPPPSNGIPNTTNGHAKKDDDMKARNEEQVTPLWQKILGYIWVLFFFVLVNPWFMYPSIRQPAETFWIMPFRIADNIGLPASAAMAAVGALIVWIGFDGEI